MSVVLCIFGSRTIKNIAVAQRAIEEGLVELGLTLDDIDVVMDGEAGGMDNQGHFWAKRNGLSIDRKPAKWKDLCAPGAVVRVGPHGPYNVVAGHQRNQEMAEAATHFIGVRDKGKSTGTDDMIKRVKKTEKPFSLIRL